MQQRYLAWIMHCVGIDTVSIESVKGVNHCQLSL